MSGDDRVRFCGLCRKNVYNLGALTAAEIADLVAAREGDLCARFYRRADGTALTADCPVGAEQAAAADALRLRRQQRGVRARAVALVGALLGTLGGIWSRFLVDADLTHVDPGIDIIEFETLTMGRLILPPLPPKPEPVSAGRSDPPRPARKRARSGGR